MIITTKTGVKGEYTNSEKVTDLDSFYEAAFMLSTREQKSKLKAPAYACGVFEHRAKKGLLRQAANLVKTNVICIDVDGGNLPATVDNLQENEVDCVVYETWSSRKNGSSDFRFHVLISLDSWLMNDSGTNGKGGTLKRIIKALVEQVAPMIESDKVDPASASLSQTFIFPACVNGRRALVYRIKGRPLATAHAIELVAAQDAARAAAPKVDISSSDFNERTIVAMCERITVSCYDEFFGVLSALKASGLPLNDCVVLAYDVARRSGRDLAGRDKDWINNGNLGKKIAGCDGGYKTAIYALHVAQFGERETKGLMSDIGKQIAKEQGRKSEEILNPIMDFSAPDSEAQTPRATDEQPDNPDPTQDQIEELRRQKIDALNDAQDHDAFAKSFFDVLRENMIEARKYNTQEQAIFGAALAKTFAGRKFHLPSFSPRVIDSFLRPMIAPNGAHLLASKSKGLMGLFVNDRYHWVECRKMYYTLATELASCIYTVQWNEDKHLFELKGHGRSRRAINELANHLSDSALSADSSSIIDRRLNELSGVPTRNAYIDWRTMGLRKMTLADATHHKDVLDISIHRKLDTSTVDRVLGAWRSRFESDDVAQYVLMHMASAMFGHATKRKKALYFYGPKDCGKSRTADIISLCFAGRNASSSSVELGKDTRFTSAETYLALVHVGPDQSNKPIANEGLFKAWTGGDLMRYEEKGIQGEHSVRPVGLWIMQGNCMPSFRKPDPAAVDRIEVVPFNLDFCLSRQKQFDAVVNQVGGLSLFAELLISIAMRNYLAMAKAQGVQVPILAMPKPVAKATDAYKMSANLAAKLIWEAAHLLRAHKPDADLKSRDARDVHSLVKQALEGVRGGAPRWGMFEQSIQERPELFHPVWVDGKLMINLEWLQLKLGAL